MKILHVFDGYGGPKERVAPHSPSVAKVVYWLAKYLMKKHEVTILERGQEGESQEAVVEGIRYVKVRQRELPAPPYQLVRRPDGTLYLFLDSTKMALKINNFLKNEKYDIIHVHFPFAASILITINQKLREKMTYTAHIGEETKRLALDSSTPLALRLFSPDLYLMKRVAKTVVLNEALRRKLIAKGFSKEKLESIPNGVNVEDFSVPKEKVERVKEKYRLKGTVVMFAGTVTPRKGVEYLIRAGEILKNEKALFLIVGNLNLDRGYAERVMEYARRKGVNAKFTGFVPYKDLKALYSACDIFVLPSFEEGDPISLKEALASGKPLIGSNVGGIPMQIKDGWNGFLVSPGNIEELAEKIRYLIDHPEERERMGRNSRKLAQEEFDWSKIAEKYLKVYESILHH